MLLVEDDGEIASSLRILLRFLGYDVRAAHNLEEAKKQLRPDLACILLDLILPDGDGCEVMQLAQERRISAPFVVVTGTQDDALLERVNSFGPDRLIRKPAPYTEIVDTMEAVLRSE